jgi:hypothetical protein
MGEVLADRRGKTRRETVETVPLDFVTGYTQLKLGVNEREPPSHIGAYIDS